jgi:hypothetical protein
MDNALVVSETFVGVFKTQTWRQMLGIDRPKINPVSPGGFQFNKRDRYGRINLPHRSVRETCCDDDKIRGIRIDSRVPFLGIGRINRLGTGGGI